MILCWKFNGRSTRALLFEWEKTVSGSPHYRRLRALRSFTTADKDQLAQLDIERAGQQLTVSVERKGSVPRALQKPDNFAQLEDGVVYVDLGRTSRQSLYRRISELSEAKAVILDVRGRVRGFDMISHLIDRPVQSVHMLMPQVIFPGSG